MIKILRPLNLLFLGLIEFLLYVNIITPILLKYGLEPKANPILLASVILGSMFICAGGYIINDYFDRKIDLINKPKDIIVGKTISKQGAMRYYQVMTGIGLLLGLVPSFLMHDFTLGFIFLSVPGMLWFYSSTYKRQFLVGNIMVALASALALLLPVLVEMQALKLHYDNPPLSMDGLQLDYVNPIFKTLIPSQLYVWSLGFAAFAFLWTLIREIIKDVEDIEGDRENECHTLAVVWGIPKARLLVSGLIVLGLFLLRVLVHLGLEHFLGLPKDIGYKITEYFILLFIGLPSILIIYFMFTNQAKNWTIASQIAKLTMFFGILYSFVFYYIVAANYGLTIYHSFTIA